MFSLSVHSTREQPSRSSFLEHWKSLRSVPDSFYFRGIALMSHPYSLYPISSLLLWNFRHFSASKDRRRFKRTFSNLLSVANRLNLQMKKVWFVLVDGWSMDDSRVVGCERQTRGNVSGYDIYNIQRKL